jgi:spore germination protein YaaH
MLALIMLLAAGSGYTASVGSLWPAGTVRDGQMNINRQAKRFNMTYIYFGDPASYIGRVDGTRGSLDHVAPSYFDLNEDGTLRLTKAADRNFVEAMHERGIRVTPFLSNHWDRESGIKALDRRELLAAQIAEAVAEYDLDGVNVDIENVTEAERDKYTDFVRILRQMLPADKSISVAVAANPSGSTEGWHASYDPAGLLPYCDYLMVMAYDQHYIGDVEDTGGAGPVAGYGFVEESIKAALKEIPPGKLVLGVPFYGRLWKRGAGYGGYGISNNTVEKLVRDYNGKVIFDEGQGSPRAVITIKPADLKPVISGVELEPGTYDIWYENEASIKRKLELVEKYGLKGTGSWSLGQETKETWDYYSLWLDGIYFSDIQRHWAKASIAAAVLNGWMKGVSGTRFEPESPLTRAQAATLLTRVLGIDVSSNGPDALAFTIAEVPDCPVFTDTEGHWAQKEIDAAAKAGIFRGVGGGRFKPDEALTREQIAVLLDRLLDHSDHGTACPASFADIDPSRAWSYDAICRMAAGGFIRGFPDGTFRPKEAVNRGQVAVLVERIAPDIGI